MRYRYLILAAICLIHFLPVGSALEMRVVAEYVPETQWPKLWDDKAFDQMPLAIKRQKAAFERSPMHGTLVIGEDRYELQHLKHSLEALESMVSIYQTCLKTQTTDQVCLESFSESMKQKFKLYRAGQKNAKAHLTAYYSPTLKGARTQSDAFPFGIYRMPKKPELKQLTQVEILFDQRLEGYGLSEFYVQNIFDLYLLQVEGGGRIEEETADGIKYHYLSYEGSNGRSFRFISQYMLEQRMISDRSIESQRHYLLQYPERAREIFSFSPSFVFFRVSETEPVGQENIPLTPGRSIALDRSFFVRKGLISLVQGEVPIELEHGKVKTKPFSRFFINQDTGGAIKGEARADLYMGYGPEAELAANYMNDSQGSIFFLLAR